MLDRKLEPFKSNILHDSAFAASGINGLLRRLNAPRDFLLPFRLEPDPLGFAPMAAATTTTQGAAGEGTRV
jgi:hypothetical protein